MSFVTKNKDVFSATDESPSVISLMEIKSNKGKSMEPWGIPALRFFDVEIVR